MMKRIRTTAAGDGGISMITVLLVGLLLTAMASSMAVISSSNLRNAGRDRVAGAAMGSAEAGVAEAIAYLRTTNTVTALACSPNCGATNPWGEDDPAVRKSLTFPDGGTAKVHVVVDQAFNPPAVKTAVYTIKSDGTAGAGPGLRRLEQTVTVEPLPFPIGVYANKINLNGTPQTFQQSVFSTECINGRDKMIFSGTDAYYGIPAAAHSTKFITTDHNDCSATDSRNIHRSATCNPAYPFDQDKLGGPVGGACAAAPGGTSYFDQAMLDQYGRQLTNDQLAALRTAAQAQGQYYNGTTSITPPNPAVYPNAVLFFDLAPNQSISIQNELDAYTWNGSCTSPPRTVFVVVNHSSVGSGQVKLNSNADLSGAIFVQRGDFEFNGTATFTGTLVANTISKWNGNATSQLTSCYLQNLPPGVMEVTATRFREVDS